MKTILLGCALILVGSATAFWAGATLFAIGADSDRNGTTGQFDPLVIASFTVALCAACTGLVMTVYGLSKRSRSRGAGSNRQN